ncbi:MAG: 2-oxoacid:ferredoxin oxidoreductase subunit beta [Bacteroidetes bacterium]|nr:2-oxoacid:ferredoxin oxidoreductase subunit beta [Bacteroidota bacterium]
MKRTLQDYKSVITPVWCPGCGDYGILSALQKALLELDIPPEKIATVSGIGCSGRFSHFMNTYSLHGTHGRAVPTAIGVKAANPDMTVFAVGGDGDGLGIGGGHISHAARKNVDMTYILIDNRIYGLTKGQSSPTSPLDKRTKTSPYGVYESPLSPMPIFLAYDISYIALGNSTNPKEMQDIIVKAVQHKGMSMVYIMASCRTFPMLEPKGMKSMFEALPDDYDKTNKLAAMEKAYSTEPIYTGVYYQVEKPSLEDNLLTQIRIANRKRPEGEVTPLEEVLQSYA